MINCPGIERGVLCILIIDPISISALVLFSLLCAINYHYNKGYLNVDFFKWKIIHRRLLRIAVLQSILLWWFINFLKFTLSRDTPEWVYFMLLSLDLRWLSYFYHFLYETVTEHLFYQKHWIFSFVIFLNTTFSQQSKKSIIWFPINSKKRRHYIPVTKTKQTLKDGELLGSADGGKLDLDS